MTEAAWSDEEHRAPPHNPHRAGFTLTFAGLFAMFLGVVAFLWGQRIPPLDMSRYVWREVAGIAIGFALPLFLLGVSHSLPGRAWARATAYVGVAACVGGIAAFAWLYPYSWNVAGRDMSPYGIVPYGVGVVLLGASGFMGLIEAYLERRAARVAAPSAAFAGPAEAPVTEDEIMRDIEEQTRRQRLSWGGIMISDGPSIKLDTTNAPVVALSGSVGRKFTLDNLDTEPEVDRLLAFRGVKKDVQEEQESQAEALIRLRQQMGQKKTNGKTPRAFKARGSRWSRFWSRITGR